MDQSSRDFDPLKLLDAARNGDVRAVSEVMEQYRPYLAMLARLRTGDHLQARYDDSDLVQETLIQVQRGLQQFQGRTEAEFTAWLRRIMASVSGKQVRHHLRQRRDATLEQQLENDYSESAQLMGNALIALDASPSESVMRRERAVILSQALSQLPSAYRDALVINRLEGQTIAQTAERMGRSVDSVQKLLARGIVELRQKLEGFL